MSKTIQLTYPVTINGTEHKTLTLRRSKIKDRLAVSKMTCTDEEKEIRLFANLCEVAPEVLMELDEADYKKLQTEYMGFFEFRATSTKP